MTRKVGEKLVLLPAWGLVGATLALTLVDSGIAPEVPASIAFLLLLPVPLILSEDE